MLFHLKKSYSYFKTKTFLNLFILLILFTTTQQKKIHFDQNIRNNLEQTINIQIFHCQETLSKQELFGFSTWYVLAVATHLLSGLTI